FAVPPAMAAALVASAVAQGRFYRQALRLQLSAYALAALSGLLVASGRSTPRTAAPLYAFAGQLAMALAPLRALRGNAAAWRPTARARAVSGRTCEGR